MRNLAFEAQ